MSEVFLDSSKTEKSNEVETLTQEQKNLSLARENRRFAFNEIFADFFNDLQTKIDKNKKCRKKNTLERIRFYSRMQSLSTAVFETEEEEYQAINKFGRGVWETDTLHEIFDKDEFDIVVQIAHSYGAFNY